MSGWSGPILGQRVPGNTDPNAIYTEEMLGLPPKAASTSNQQTLSMKSDPQQALKMTNEPPAQYGEEYRAAHMNIDPRQNARAIAKVTYGADGTPTYHQLNSDGTVREEGGIHKFWAKGASNAGKAPALKAPDANPVPGAEKGTSGESSDKRRVGKLAVKRYSLGNTNGKKSLLGE